MKIKICRPWIRTRGGAERVVLEIARRLAPKHELEFITNYYEPKLTFPEFKNFEVKVHPTGFPYKWKLSRALGSAIFFSNWKSNADLIISDISPSHWTANKNNNVIWFCHTPLRDSYDLLVEHVRERPFYSQPFYRFSANIYRYFDKKFVPKVKYICVNSRVTQDRVRKYYNRNSEIIHPGVNPEEFHCGDYKKYFLWVGRFMPHKRPQLAIDAIGDFSKKRKDFHLRMIGGELERGMSTRLNAYAKVSYHASDRELKDFYANCMGFVYTSSNEEWSITTLEAMASGKPIIAVNEGCAKELVRDNVNGILCEPNAESISKAMQWIASHPAEAERMGRNSRKIVEKGYTWKIFGDEFERMLGKVLKTS
jgi:glycosyltransferase involved in cell wall biosynthesis